MYVAFVYFPPQGSSFYHGSERDILEELEDDLSSLSSNAGALLMGDFNARIGKWENKNFKVDVSELQMLQNNEEEVSERESMDHKVNTRGRDLIAFCERANLWCFNGTLPGDRRGAWTFHNHFGTSVIDFAFGDTLTYERSLDFRLGARYLHSDHYPIIMEIEAPISKREQVATTARDYASGFHTHRSPRGDFCQAIEDDGFLLEMKKRKDQTQEGINTLGERLIHRIQQAATKVFGRRNKKQMGSSNRKVWFDNECQLMMHDIHLLIERNEEVHELFKSYKALLRRKKREWKAKEAQRIVELAKRDPSAFWRQIRGRKKEIVIRDPQTWFSHCSSLYNNPPTILEDTLMGEEKATHPTVKEDNILDREIGKDEIQGRIKHMKRGKSHDIYGINIELISWGNTIVVDQLHMLFNVLFETGKFPRNWNIGTLTPIFKKGDPYECKNYRTITVGSILGKLYCAILEQRLQRWCEKHKKRARGQTGS